MILLILNTLAPNLVQKKYVKMTGYLYKKRPLRAASRDFSCALDPTLDRRRASTT